MRVFKFLFLAVLGLTLSQTDVSAQKRHMPEWMKNAIFYQVYPSSFMDTDGDGIGDLPGIKQKLDYIQSLGVNTVWMNPTFESGWEDGGYDVIDFYKIDPRFGTNDDMVALIQDAHSRGMKVLLDLVAGHSSDKNPWFIESSQGTNMHYSDYYIWADDLESNNQGVDQAAIQVAPMMRGRFVEGKYPRAKYYQRNAGPFQPALNYGFANPDPNHPWEQSVNDPGPQAMRRELRNIMQFWFEKGVDGFRVDMAASLVKNDQGSRENIKLWSEIRSWMEEAWPDRVLVSEWGNPSIAVEAGFHMDFMFHFGIPGYPQMLFARETPFGNYGRGWTYPYCYFDLAAKGEIKTFVDSYLDAWRKTRGSGYISIPSSNHDYQRPNVGTRNTIDQLKVTMTFFLTMPGVPIINYGDEIGMKFYMDLPSKEGSGNRSGVRTPMQWTTGYNAGYSTCTPDKLYLPIDTDGGALTVEAQENDPNSLLNYTRTLLALRKSSPALGNDADWELVSNIDQPYPMVYKRTDGNETYLIALNPGKAGVTAKIAHQDGKVARIMVGSSKKNSYKFGKDTDTIKMDGVSALVYKIQ